MKVQRFLEKLQELMVYNESIDNYSMKKFTKLFQSCLSKNEKVFYALSIDLILENTKKQKTIQSIVNKINTQQLEFQLEAIKKD